MFTRHRVVVGERTASHRPCDETAAGRAGRRFTAVTVLAVAGAIAASLALAGAASASGGEVASWGNNTYGQLGNGEKGTPHSKDTPVHVCSTGGCSHNLEGVIAISAGGSHSLALLSGGEVVAWGRGQEGALGDNDPAHENEDVPVYVCETEYTGSLTGKGIIQCPHLKGVTAISAGNGSSNIALLASDKVVTWGSNMDGQLGDGTLTPTPGFSDVPERVCAPNPLFTQCKTGTYAGHYLEGVSAVSAAPDHDAAIVQPGGELFTWGVNNRGQLGQGDWSLYNDVPEHVCEVEYTYTVVESPNNILPHCGPGHYLTGVELISFGLRHNIAEFSGVYCHKVKIGEGGNIPGEGEKCRIRDGEPAQEAPAEKGKKGKKEKGNEEEKGHEGSGRTWEEEGYEWIEEQARHAVVAFGNNEEGQLGDGLAVEEAGWASHTGGPASCESGTPCSEVPVHVCSPAFTVKHDPCSFPEYLEPVTAVAAGGDHSLALNVSGEVLSWGDNQEGEEGDFSHSAPNECSFTPTVCVAVPKSVTAGGITGLSGGSFHELALKSTGEVLAWGRGAAGQLGDETFAEATSPQVVCAAGGCGGGPLTGVTAVSAGSNHSLALGEFPSAVGWRQKGSELPLGGPPVAVKTSGSLTLQTEAGPVACKVKDVEEIWNPAHGNGEDRITSFVLKCKSKLCPKGQTTVVNALGLPWPSHLTATSQVRDEIEKIDLEVRCSGSGLLDDYKGTLAPEVGNSVLTFGPGSGELEDSLHHKATLTGTDKLAGKITA
jgi:alpha-tubulin suppressor-like RCC1 family protein